MSMSGDFLEMVIPNHPDELQNFATELVDFLDKKIKEAKAKGDYMVNDAAALTLAALPLAFYHIKGEDEVMEQALSAARSTILRKVFNDCVKTDAMVKELDLEEMVDKAFAQFESERTQ